jgi:hypothetical protein
MQDRGYGLPRRPLLRTRVNKARSFKASATGNECVLRGKEQAIKKKQRVAEMADEVLARQARARAERTGEPFEVALKAVRKTEAGRQLEELGEGPHGREKANQWQEGLARERTEERAEAPGWSSPADPVGGKEEE